MQMSEMHQPRSSSLQLKIVAMVFVTAVVVAGLTSGIVYVGIRQALEEQFRGRILNIVTMAALAQQGDAHASLATPSDEESPEFFKISQQNSDIVKSDPMIGALYTLRQDDKKNIYFVVYSEQSSLSERGRTVPSLGQTYANASPLLIQEFTSFSVPTVETTPRSDTWGTWLSAYAPFYRSDGTREGVVAIDANTDPLVTAENNALLTAFGIFALLTPIIALAGWILGNNLAKPIINMNKTLAAVSAGDRNQHINVTETDELGELGQSVNRLIAEANESITKAESRIQEYSAQLEEQSNLAKRLSSVSEKQSKQIRTLSLVVRALISIQNLEGLLPRIAAIMSEQLSYYHVGIFLVDDAHEYAILSASNSLGGQKMLERNHRLRVGQEGVVGFAAGTGRLRIANDTEKDTAFLPNPDLPGTHSEMAIPLRTGRDVIGILDLQSTEFMAFNEEDTEFMNILADQVSIAIQSARRYQETRKTISESETLYRNYLRQEWKSLAAKDEFSGFLYNISGSKPLEKKIQSDEIKQAIQSGKPTISQEKSQSQLAVPIKLRGEVIGILNIRSGSGYAWQEDEVDIAAAVADRVALAVENARLLEDSQSRAARERTIGEITSKIGASINIRNVLQTAVEELGHILPGSDVIIQLTDSDTKAKPEERG